jgi:hypothetical protein
MITEDQRHKHTWLAWDWEKIKYSDLEWAPDNSEKKYCFAYTSVWWLTWNYVDLEDFETNDSWMSATANQITITKNWLYEINWSAYVSSDVQAHWVGIFVNWTQWAMHFDNNYYKNTYRSIRPVLRKWRLSVWDVVKLYIIWTQYNYDNPTTFLQVVEI